jgi:hypothetical protein
VAEEAGRHDAAHNSLAEVVQLDAILCVFGSVANNRDVEQVVVKVGVVPDEGREQTEPEDIHETKGGDEDFEHVVLNHLVGKLRRVSTSGVVHCGSVDQVRGLGFWICLFFWFLLARELMVMDLSNTEELTREECLICWCFLWNGAERLGLMIL